MLTEAEKQFATWLYTAATPADNYTDGRGPFVKANWGACRRHHDGLPPHPDDAIAIRKMMMAAVRVPVDLRLLMAMKGWIT